MFARQQSILNKHQTDRATTLASHDPGRMNTSGNTNTNAASDHANVAVPLNPGRAPETTAARNTPPATTATKSDATDTATEGAGSRLIVGPDVKLKGAEILDCDTLIVEGSVEATMDSRVIRITEGGAFNGKVGIDVAEIFGDFDGELTARKQLVIHASGRVRGTIRYGQLLIETGGILAGDIQSLTDSHASRQQSPVKPEKEVSPLTKPHLSPIAG